ncbi:sigma-70 family RNA polymerase sigma factor [Leptolyngbya sp. FACHB-541]|uniref:sigma-70 family RNA polymerase sigma factor n=1 Tax=Leptolyngbya sp. FACHB-541 TaxID=2692810 RepID=UPI0016889FB4|nr:sigma-70 family RNA polymerase sigma factor [Leptolyngbya sp. FACHB-541]MBD1999327.1 sigma-70 family RNA polymerase sigma factor [Leptolyngbya sp. FACHB-541]
MGELDQQLRELVIEACQHPLGSPKRQRALTKVIRLSSSKLWRDSSPHYADALQQTWVYFCQNVCEAKTGNRYDPSQSTVHTWLNAYLKRRLQDFYIDTQKQQATRATPQTWQTRSGDVEEMDPIANLAAEPDVPPLLDEVSTWAKTDDGGELRRVHIEGHTQVNCQLLILRRLPPETSWKDLSAEFGLNVSTLSSFYQRQCMPRLRKFGESEGYI